MKKLIIPSKLNKGDTVAFISISGGRAGDEDMIPRYLLGKRRFEKIFHVKVVETPHALRGSEYLYEHPEKRAECPATHLRCCQRQTVFHADVSGIGYNQR